MQHETQYQAVSSIPTAQHLVVEKQLMVIAMWFYVLSLTDAQKSSSID